jgi:hypothetical protein
MYTAANLTGKAPTKTHPLKERRPTLGIRTPLEDRERERETAVIIFHVYLSREIAKGRVGWRGLRPVVGVFEQGEIWYLTATVLQG